MNQRVIDKVGYLSVYRIGEEVLPDGDWSGRLPVSLQVIGQVGCLSVYR